MRRFRNILLGCDEGGIHDALFARAIRLANLNDARVTVGGTGIPGVIIGNAAEAILSRVKCSVLAVKPPDFETPVSLESGTKDLSRKAIVENLPIDGRANAQAT